MSNKQLGTEFERQLCLILARYGFWVHPLAQNSQGQPFDMIAARGGQTHPIDCKVCEKNIFRLERVEENQHLAMQLWRDTRNGEGWFALQLSDGAIYFFPFSVIKEAIMFPKHVLSEQEIRAFGVPVSEWVSQCK